MIKTTISDDEKDGEALTTLPSGKVADEQESQHQLRLLGVRRKQHYAI